MDESRPRKEGDTGPRHLPLTAPGGSEEAIGTGVLDFEGAALNAAAIAGLCSKLAATIQLHDDGTYKVGSEALKCLVRVLDVALCAFETHLKMTSDGRQLEALAQLLRRALHPAMGQTEGAVSQAVKVAIASMQS